jgi:uncharacterized protein (DUF885 family)
MQAILKRAAAAVALTLIVVPASSAFAQATAATAPQSESARLNAWFEAKYEEMLRFSPMELTSLGRKELYDKLDDTSLEAADARLAWYKASVDEMERNFDHAKLNADARLSYDLWKYDYAESAEAAKWRDNAYIFTQMQGAHTFLPSFLISLHRVDSRADMDAYIARVSQFDAYFGELLERAEAGAARGVRPPYFAYDIVIAELKKLTAGAPFDSGTDNAIWADGKAKIDALAKAGTIDAAAADELRSRLERALKASYLPAYQKLLAFMERDRPNAPKVATGVGGLPGGEDYYASRLKISTTTDLTPDEVHQIGLDEVKRLRGEMETVKRRVGFDGDLQAFFKHVEADPENYFPNTDAGRQAYLDEATAVIANIRKELPAFFGILPKAEIEVRRVEPFREQPGAAQHYRGGTPDGSRPGIYYVHLADTTTMPKNDLEVVAYHEGIPGHHMQISIAQELTGVPTFRTQFGYGAYVEGWALYSEALAKEMPGTYQDANSEFGRLSSENWRAIRLVLDTGLHAKGWTEQQAIDYFRENSATPLETIRSEVRRYIVWPGQASSYKIGMLKIQELRRKAEGALGGKFDIRAFHDVVLGDGALPLSLLEQRVDRYIAETKAS